jgi:hypothetical protein
MAAWPARALPSPGGVVPLGVSVTAWRALARAQQEAAELVSAQVPARAPKPVLVLVLVPWPVPRLAREPAGPERVQVQVPAQAPAQALATGGGSVTTRSGLPRYQAAPAPPMSRLTTPIMIGKGLRDCLAETEGAAGLGAVVARVGALALPPCAAADATGALADVG